MFDNMMDKRMLDHSEPKGGFDAVPKDQVLEAIRQNTLSDRETNELMNTWLSQQEAWSTKENTVRSQIEVSMNEAELWLAAGDLDAALDCLRVADDQAFQDPDGAGDLTNLIYEKAMAITALQNRQTEKDPEALYKESPTPEDFLNPSAAKGKDIRTVKTGNFEMPTSFDKKNGRFRLQGEEKKTGEGAIISGRVGSTIRGDLYKIDHIKLVAGLDDAAGNYTGVAPALLNELELEFRLRNAAAIYVMPQDTEHVDFLLKKGYSMISAESLDDDTRRVLKIPVQEGQILLAKELKQQAMECVALAKELAARPEGLSFPGITEEAYQGLLEIEEFDPEHEYSAPVEPMLQKYRDQGMRLVLAKDDPEQPNMYFLPKDSEDTPRSEEALYSKHLLTTEGMDEDLKKFILLYNERFGKK